MNDDLNIDLKLRPITLADKEPLYDLHRAAMRTNVEATWGWDEDIQREFWKRTAHDGIQVIEHDEKLIGFLDVQQRDDHIDIVNIEVDPSVQGQGLGSTIIRRIIEDANSQGMDVRLQVLKANHRARSLYQRLGFEEDGETHTHKMMVRKIPG